MFGGSNYAAGIQRPRLLKTDTSGVFVSVVAMTIKDFSRLSLYYCLGKSLTYIAEPVLIDLLSGNLVIDFPGKTVEALCITAVTA